MHSIDGRSVRGQIGKFGAEVQGVKEELAAASRSSSDFDDEQMVSQKRQASRSRSSIPGKMDNSAADAAMMGGLHSESKVADLRMWLAGDTKGGGKSVGSSLIDILPYALPIVAACILVMVIIAVRILRKHQPQSTTYINAALSNVKGGLTGKTGRRY